MRVQDNGNPTFYFCQVLNAVHGNWEVPKYLMKKGNYYIQNMIGSAKACHMVGDQYFE